MVLRISGQKMLAALLMLTHKERVWFAKVWNMGLCCEAVSSFVIANSKVCTSIVYNLSLDKHSGGLYNVM